MTTRSYTPLDMLRAVVVLVVVALFPATVFAQVPASRVLFRVFLTDGRVLSSYGEWSRSNERVVFSMPTQLTREPMELHLVDIPARQVDWPRTERYAESVRAAAYAASRGDADFKAFSDEVAAVLNEISNITDARSRLATAERARQKLADWPAAHYGYRNAEVREALNVLDEVIAQLRVAVGITRFDLSLSANAPLTEPPPPPLPPPSDAELVEQFATAAAISDSPPERLSLLQTVLRLIDRAIGSMPQEWVSRMRRSANGELERERRTQDAYDELRTRTLQDAARLASRGRASDLERLRDKVKEEDRRLGGQRAGDVVALLATIDLHAAAAVTTRDKRKLWDRRAPAYRRYRRSTNGAFKVFNEAAKVLEQVREMTAPPPKTLDAQGRRVSAASRSFMKVRPPVELAPAHMAIGSVWDLAQNAFRLRAEATSRNSVDGAERASSAAAGALLLYQRARAEQLAIMEKPTGQ